MKKAALPWLLFLCVITFFFPAESLAAENYKEFTKKDNVDLHHDWTITFSQTIDEHSINDLTVYIEDESGQKVSNNRKVTGTQKAIILYAPEQGYENGMTYTLYIHNGVKSADGEPLSEEVKMQFTTESQLDGLLAKYMTGLYIGMPMDDFKSVKGEPDVVDDYWVETRFVYQPINPEKIYGGLVADFNQDKKLTYFEQILDVNDPLIANKTVDEAFYLLRDQLIKKFGRQPDEQYLTPSDIEGAIPNNGAYWYEGTERFELNVSEPLFEPGGVIPSITSVLMEDGVIY